MSSLNHLRIYSEYSIGRGIIRINELIKKAGAYQVQSLALTDSNNLFAAVHFYQAAFNAGIKPIIASEISYQYSDDSKVYKVCLYCQNQSGYENLSRIVSEIYQSNQNINLDSTGSTGSIQSIQSTKLSVSFDFLIHHSAGLIALNGGLSSDLYNQSKEIKQSRLQKWQQTFGDRFYLEVSQPSLDEQKKWFLEALELAKQNDIAVVATHPTFFLEKDDYLVHQIRTSIDQKLRVDNPERDKIANQNQYLLNQAEFDAEFENYDANLIKNNEIIAKRCNFKFEFETILAPKFETEEGQNNQTEAKVLTHLAISGLVEKTRSLNLDQKTQKVYLERVHSELAVIKKMKFSGYFLVVADYVNWAKNNEVPVAPGRGSGAGSLVAFALNITDVDPIEHNLIFERFLNPDRVSMPDFDIDFCAHKRSKVLNYIKEKYKKQIPVQIITFGSMNAKAVVRDVARVLSYPYAVGDKIAREVVGSFKLSQLIGNQKQVLKERLEENKLQLENAEDNYENPKSEDDIKKEVQEFFTKAAKFQQLYQEDEEVRDVVDNSIKLEGLVRNVGTHAGGVLIAPDDIRKFCPVYCDADKPNQLVSQFDMKSAEAIGLIKFDFLGVSALSVIKGCLDIIEADYGKKLNLLTLKPNHKKVYSLLRQGFTCGIFQLESPGCKRMIADMKIENFDELIASLALYRPGPLGSKMDKEFINLKKGFKQPEYLLPELIPILSDTRGVLIYQEQVMKIAQEICGYSLAQADMLRKAMGKKDAEIMNQQKQSFIDGGIKQGFEQEKLESIFNQIVKFAEYGFNKSHSVAYAMVSYYTAYLKTFYPAVFYAVEMSEHFNDSKSLYARILEIKKFGKVKLIEPNINSSEYLFKSNSKNEIQYALGAIKGIGAKAADEIVLKRKQGALFQDFADFCQRVDFSKVNKGTIQSLILSGAMDNLAPTMRKVKIDNLVDLMSVAAQFKKGSELGMNSLFESEQGGQFNYQFKGKTDFAHFERLERQFKVLGYYPNETPLDYYENQFKHLAKKINISTLIENKFKHQKQGQFYLFATLEYFAQDIWDKKVIGRLRISDSKGNNFEIRTSLDKFNKIQETLQKNRHLVCLIDIDSRYNCHLLEIYSLADFRADELEFMIDLKAQSLSKIKKINQAIKNWFEDAENFGRATLLLNCDDENQAGSHYLIDLGEDYHFHPTDKNLDELQYLTDFKLNYRPKIS